MIRLLTRWLSLAALACAAGAPPAHAQLLALRPDPPPIPEVVAPAPGELHGVIEDDRGRPLAGAVVSALGATTAFAVSDREGRYAFRSLPPGPYLVRVHLQGYTPPRARVIQVNPRARATSTIALAAASDAAAPRLLTAGVGGEPDAVPAGETPEHEHGEVEWRLRHQKRSVLKEAQNAAAELGDDESLFEDGLNGLGRAMGQSARLATALFTELPLTGQLNLLTTTSFDRPQDLFLMGTDAPRGVAYLALTSPGGQGEWTMRGSLTQGDLSSWILAGSYRRTPEDAHAYEAGVSYSMQRYMGGNSEALLAMRDGSRNAGEMYAYDDWTVSPRLRVGYGARYARYDYLPDEGLLSPRASITVRPSARDSLALRATVSHRETAPGADEFLPPAAGPWLPPERTFSHVSRGQFRAERLDHAELAVEREWPLAVLVGVRAFHQRVDDQVVTLFGVAAVTESSRGVGHYRVGSAGGFEARGWGVSVSRAVGAGTRAGVDYTQFDADWTGAAVDRQALSLLAASVLRDAERVHDVTASVESLVAPTATRVFVVYKLNTGFARPTESATASRFNVQVNQALPFLDFSAANWEMLVAVSNLFRTELFDGSVYDELLVVDPPKRVLGGVTVRF